MPFDTHDASVDVLTQQHGSILIRSHAIGTVIPTDWQVALAVIAAWIENLSDSPSGAPDPVAGRQSERESSRNFFDLRIFGDKFVKCDNAADGSRGTSPRRYSLPGASKNMQPRAADRRAIAPISCIADSLLSSSISTSLRRRVCSSKMEIDLKVYLQYHLTISR
jgi:hypothetical protein